MTIVNLDKVTAPIIVLTGRPSDIHEVAYHLVKEPLLDKLELPLHTTYYQEYPAVVQRIVEHGMIDRERLLIETQSIEFLDILLESDLEFQLVTVRHDGEVYRLRVLEKEEARSNRENFSMELRA